MAGKVKRLHYVLFHSEGALTEFFLGLMSLTWGLWVLSPFWDAFGASSSFAIMAQIAPEPVWGAAMAIIGLFKINFVLSENRKYKRIVFTLSLFAWMCIAVAFIAVSPGAVGTAIYSLIAAMNAFCIWRDAGIE
jgi:hypothetical protein